MNLELEMSQRMQPMLGGGGGGGGGYNLQRNCVWSYDHLASSHEWGQMHTMTESTVNRSSPQVSMKAGLWLFGKAGNAAVKSEMGQLHK